MKERNWQNSRRKVKRESYFRSSKLQSIKRLLFCKSNSWTNKEEKEKKTFCLSCSSCSFLRLPLSLQTVSGLRWLSLSFLFVNFRFGSLIEQQHQTEIKNVKRLTWAFLPFFLYSFRSNKSSINLHTNNMLFYCFVFSFDCFFFFKMKIKQKEEEQAIDLRLFD